MILFFSLWKSPSYRYKPIRETLLHISTSLTLCKIKKKIPSSEGSTPAALSNKCMPK